MTNLEIAKALRNLACKIDWQKDDVPHGHLWVDVLHAAAVDIAGEQVNEIYVEDEETFTIWNRAHSHETGTTNPVDFPKAKEEWKLIAEIKNMDSNPPSMQRIYIKGDKVYGGGGGKGGQPEESITLTPGGPSGKIKW